MALQEITMRERAAQQMRKASGEQARTEAGVRALINAIVYTAKDDSLSSAEMATSLALLSGMACATLSDYAKLLPMGNPDENDILDMAERLFKTDCVLHGEFPNMGRSSATISRGFKTEIAVWQGLARTALTR